MATQPSPNWAYIPTTNTGTGITWTTNQLGTFGGMTSTGLGPVFGQQAQVPPMEASDVGITVDGLIVTVQGMKVRIPARLMQDLLTLSEMGLLDKLVPAETPDAK